ncbi:MAG: hypothetical protein SFU98_14085 [Leptospiraceae bacterium]|nr:hypothetical protein [Leptospiraceae bacterium]
MKILFLLLFQILLFESILFAESKFIDDSSLQVIAIGKRKPSNSRVIDQSACYEAASVNAKLEAIEALVDKNWPNVKGKVTKEEFKKTVVTKVSGQIKGGSITSQSYDDSTYPNTCKIVFLITKLNMDSIINLNETKTENNKGMTHETFETVQVKNGKVIVNNINYPVFKNVKEITVSAFGGIDYSFEESSFPKSLARLKSVAQFYQSKKIENILVTKFSNKIKNDIKQVWFWEGKKDSKYFCIVLTAYEDSMAVTIAPNCTEDVSQTLINN